MSVSFLAFLPFLPLVVAKELVATNDWQKVGANDTIPAGLEIRMDLSKHETLVRLQKIQEEDEEPVPREIKKRCGPSCKDRQRVRANLRGRRRTSNESPRHVTPEPLEKMAAMLFGFFFLW
eukprot:CAMPEP_0194204926 /NCGR_PEP_ID=MMETSP0156-20130528/4324_1 /TAXON_ID=33649 /ORGANISM="Thalassionema nitzschioides, Strain L26-B" /LENGTH=120 /DNA_ID=CAMNT_0038931069 /DNA_START=199 /DNA_END=558 /DNA_ORIENTATION=+